MKHPKQLDEVGITEKYLKKLAKKEKVSYRKLVQISMEEFGKAWLSNLNDAFAQDLRVR